jgi:hypothetical protein
VAIDKILQHLQAKGVLPPPAELLPVARAWPQADCKRPFQHVLPT